MAIRPRGSIRRGLGAQRGQAVLEWAGLLAMVAVLAIAVMSLPIGRQVDHSIECSIARVLLIDDPSCQPAGTPPEVNCKTSIETSSSSDSLEVSFIKVGHDQTLLVTKFSNGQVQYTLTDSKSAQAVANVFQLEAQGGGVGIDAELDAAAGGALDGAHVWTFPNEAAARAFQRQVAGAGGWGQVAHDVAGLVGALPGGSLLGPVLSWGLNHIGVHGAPNPSGLDPGDLTYDYTGASVIGSLNLQGNAGLDPQAAGQLDATLSGAAGARVIENAKAADTTTGQPPGSLPYHDGDIQVFLQLSGSANAQLRVALFGPGAGASGTGTAVVTLSPTGQLEQLQINASGQGTATAGVGAKSSSRTGGGVIGGGGTGGGSSSATVGATDGTGAGYVYSASLDLEHNPQAQLDLVNALTGQNAGINQLVGDINSDGTQRLQPFSATTSQSGIGIDGEIADVGAGANATVTSVGQQLQPGLIKSPGGQWQNVLCEK